jgi:hypothetical protein
LRQHATRGATDDDRRAPSVSGLDFPRKSELTRGLLSTLPTKSTPRRTERQRGGQGEGEGTLGLGAVSVVDEQLDVYQPVLSFHVRHTPDLT